MLGRTIIQKKAKLNTINSLGFVYYFCIIIAIIIKSEYIYGLICGGDTMREFYSIISTVGMLLIVLGILSLIFSKRRRRAFFIFNLLLSILLLSDTIYYRYYSNVITVSLINLLFYAEGAAGSAHGLFYLKDLIYLIDLPIMLIFTIYLDKKNLYKAEFPQRIKSFIKITATGVVVVLFVYIRANIYYHKFDPNNVTKDMGIVYFHYYDVKRFIADDMLASNKMTKREEKEVRDMLTQKEKERNTGIKKYRGIAKGKNLVVIQLEAFQQFVINRKVNGVEITPNLNKLIKDSLYFDNYYYQVIGGNTSDAEFLSNNSLYPVPQIDGTVYVNYFKRKYHSLNSILKDKGYGSYVFHGYRPDFWNRDAMYESEGFDKFISGKDYKAEKKFGMGVSDNQFFKQSLQMMGDKLKQEQPFYSFFITLSGHHPFANFSNYPFDAGDVNGTEVGNFIRAANYEDKVIAKFIKELKAKGLYDNTIIAIYGDHNALDKTDETEIDKFFKVSKMSTLKYDKLQRVPLIIHSAEFVNKGKTIHTTGGQVDLVPTLANLMDFKCPYALGKDLVNTKYGYAIGIARTDSIITDRYLYAKDDGVAYDLKTGKRIPKAYYRDEVNRFRKEENVSHIIVKKDAFKTIKFGDDKKKNKNTK